MKKMHFGWLAILAACGIADAGEQPYNRPNHQISFDAEGPSQDTRLTVAWILSTGNNARLPFVILDKNAAKVFVFQSDGRLRGAAAALIGAAVGDTSVPDIGTRALSAIRPEERTTPAGRFVAALGRNLKNHQILWVDYESALSLHVVTTSNALERRAQRLATATPLDNRISYGCINVSADFFRDVVRPAFTGTNGIVYILPETQATLNFFVAPASENSIR